MNSRIRSGLLLAVASVCLANCAKQISGSVQPEAPGFLIGLFQGAIAPLAFVGSLFEGSIHVYSIPNDGGWYNFGFLLGVGFWGGGAAASR